MTGQKQIIQLVPSGDIFVYRPDTNEIGEDALHYSDWQTDGEPNLEKIEGLFANWTPAADLQGDDYRVIYG
jgi:hypothetical protein